MMGLNLHAAVRGMITAVHPDETVTLYQATGQSNTKGKLVPVYAAAQNVQAQVQSESDDKLFHTDRKGENETTRRMYLFADPDSPDTCPAGVVRPLARGGDMIQRSNGTWWLITGTLDDFSHVGWVGVRAVLQVTAPEGVTP